MTPYFSEDLIRTGFEFIDITDRVGKERNLAYRCRNHKVTFYLGKPVKGSMEYKIVGKVSLNGGLERAVERVEQKIRKMK